MKIWNPEQLDESGNASDTFEGIVESYDWVMTDYGERFIIYIKPTSYDGPIRKWGYKYSQRKKSVWGTFIDALLKAGIQISSEDDLIGKKILWEYRTIEFGENPDGSKITAKLLYPVKLLGEEPINLPKWTDNDIRTALSTISSTDTMTIDAFMHNLGIPATLKKRVMAIASVLDADGVITYDPTKMTINKK